MKEVSRKVAIEFYEWLKTSRTPGELIQTLSGLTYEEISELQGAAIAIGERMLDVANLSDDQPLNERIRDDSMVLLLGAFFVVRNKQKPN